MQNHNKPEERIQKFLNTHHVLTLATCSNNVPYCSNMFYAWLKDYSMFVFTSSQETKHTKDVIINSNVAGSVILETKVIGNLQGIQFVGKMYKPEGELRYKSKNRYLKRFPYAALMELEIWVIEVDFIKMSDNRLGFGKKLIWKRENIN